MGNVDFAKTKSDIAEIVEIVKTVPEALQQRCFEMLFEMAFNHSKKVAPKEGDQKSETKDDSVKDALTPNKKLQPNVLAFSHRHDVTREEIAKLFMIEHDPMMPVYKIPVDNFAKAQLMKVMMVLLENALLNNAFIASYNELKEAVQDDGYFEKNFPRNLRRNANLFRGAVRQDEVDESGNVELSGEGMTKLAEIVKELAK